MDLRVFVEPQQGASYLDQLGVAQTAEELGYDAFFRSDHFLKMGDVSGLPGPTDAWVTLGAIARETLTIRLGTLVTSATFRLPGPLAIQVAQVNLALWRSGQISDALGARWSYRLAQAQVAARQYAAALDNAERSDDMLQRAGAGPAVFGEPGPVLVA